MEGNDNWSSVSGLLKNVSLSTLPCAKLRAIVDAATEISRLYRNEHTTTESENGENDEDPKHLGADDFLPIFIFCVIRAEMDRPCALCKFLIVPVGVANYLRLEKNFERNVILNLFPFSTTRCPFTDIV